MQTIAVLIDFTPGSVIALKQAEQLAAKTSAVVHAIHVVGHNDEVEEAKSTLRGFVAANSDQPSKVQTEIGVGNVTSAVPGIMQKIQPDVVIVCTHGLKGLAQRLFGPKILNLAQVMRCPMIILHENNRVNLAEVESILFPLGPHAEFETKIKQTAVIAKALSASIVMYEIETHGSVVSDALEQNRNAAKKYFNDIKIEASYVLDEMKFVSAGFSRQTLAYAEENRFGLISVMASVSKNDIRFAAGDKENLVVNAEGIPVMLCMS